MKLRFRPGDIILGKRRAYQRKLAVADFEGICSAHAMVLRAKPGKIVPEFLPFFMQSDTFMERAQAISVGSLSPTINWKTLAAEEFALPPVEEQRRYAQLLLNIDHLIRSLQRAEMDASRALDAMRESHVQRLCEMRPESKRSLENVALLVTKGESPRWQGFEYVESGTRFITSENVLDGRLSIEPAKFVPSQFGEKLNRSRLAPGDILINIVGGSIGRMCVVPDGIGDSNVNQAVAVVRINPEVAMPEYILSCLLSTTLNHELCNRSVDDYKPNLSLTSIREFRIPLPSIVGQIAHLDEVQGMKQAIHCVKTRLLTVKAMMRAIIVDFAD
jgi:restriction endonuclease S subunit